TCSLGGTGVAYGGIAFAGSQTLGGNGTVTFGTALSTLVFNGTNFVPAFLPNALFLVNNGTTLTIGPGVTVNGRYGTIGLYPGLPWLGASNGTVVNQGTILSDSSFGAIALSGVVNDLGILRGSL